MSGAPGQEELEGTVVGGYRIVRRLGRGGMGAVYEAVQQSLGRRVALKRLHTHLSTDAELVLRFRREAEAAARLGHPGIVTVTDFGRADDGAAYLVMEYLDGRSLADVIRTEAPLAADRVAYVVWQILRALAVAHDAGIVHRDLKPDNVMLVEVAGVSDVVKVLDFGIAKLADAEGDAALTATGAVLGTPAYMAPEQARGGKVDARTDLYAVGAIAYEALTGRRPYGGESYNALIAAILTTTPAPLATLRADLDPELARVVSRAMETDPGQRFASASEMAAAIAPFTGGRAPSSSVATPVRVGSARTSAADAMAATALSEPRATPARTRTGVVVAIALVVAVVVVAIVARNGRGVPPSEPAPSTALAVAAASDAGTDAGSAALDAGTDAASDALDAGSDAGHVLAPPSSHAPRRVQVGYSGCDAHSMYDPADVRAGFAGVAPAIGACFTAPPSTWLEYTTVVDADGHVTDVHPHGEQGLPERTSQCVMRAFRGISLPATRHGQGGDVDISFR